MAGSLRGQSSPGDAGLEIYRNNARQFFRSALAATYPVLQRRVGEDFFRQLAHEYRAAHPSASGDLHWLGREFPSWLQARLANTPYAWLADLARLEWACEEALVAPQVSALGLDALASFPAAALDGLVVGLQPSLRLVASQYAVWSVWHANQGGTAAAPIDVDARPEHCVCACVDDRLVVYRADASDFALLTHLQRGESLAGTVASAGADASALARVLGWAFAERLVTSLSPSTA